MKRRLCGYPDTGFVIRPACSGQDARIRTELPAHLFDHLVCRFRYGFHRKGREQEGQHASDKKPNDYLRIHDINFLKMNRLRVGHKKRKCSQRRRSDRKSLSDCRGRVAHRIQGIGNLTDTLIHAGHLGDSAGIIRNRAICIHGNRTSGRCKHSDRREGDPIKSRCDIGHENTDTDTKNRHHDRLHTDRKSCDNSCAGSGL